MNRFLSVAIVAASLSAVCLAQTYDRTRPIDPSEPYNCSWDRGHLVELRGEVRSAYWPTDNVYRESRLTIVTSDGPVDVWLAPKDYVLDQKITLKPHDQVWISACQSTMPNGDRVYVARQITSGTRTWALRDDRGNPNWFTTDSARTDNYSTRAGNSKYDSRPYMWSDYRWGSVETIRGRVASIELVPAMGPAPAGVHLSVNTRDRNNYKVHLGPEWSTFNRNSTIKVGDTIEVTGSTSDRGRDKMLYPSSITIGRTTINLRDRNRGTWSSDQPMSSSPGYHNDGYWAEDSSYNRMYSRSEVQTWTGDVVSVDSYTIPNSVYPGTLVRVRVGDDVYPVHLGPTAWIDKQGYALRRGDEITLTGSMVTWDDRPVIIASQLKSGSSVWVFRDSSGRPRWISR